MSHRSSNQTMSISQDDRWLLPSCQSEYPTWDLLAEERLHGRREATFLVLGAMVLVTTTLLVVLGASRLLDPAPLLAGLSPSVELPFAMLIPFGVLPFALGGLAVSLVGELYGRRRAGALVAIGVVITAGVAGLMALADRIDGRSALLGPALAFATCFLVGHLLYVPLFDALRRRMAGRHLWLRMLVLMPITQLAGWAAFAGAMIAYARWTGGNVDAAAIAAITAIATGAAAYTLACAFVLTLPIALLALVLRRYLRVAIHDQYDEYGNSYDDGGYGKPRGVPPIDYSHRPRPAMIVDDDEPDQAGDAIPQPVSDRRRPGRPSLQPFSSAEMRFFADGDRLAEP
jgi:uncharacterized PurR-regulated membrane protein YhhQ (DUF165 family)